MRNQDQPAPLADEHIIDLFWQREESAIEETDRKYGHYLYTVAYNILYDRPDCEECQNDTYWRVWNAVPPERPVKFPVYLTRIIRHVALNRYKEKTRQKRVPSEMTDSLSELADFLEDDSTAEGTFEALELRRALNSFLRTLPDKQQVAFVSRYYFADSVAQIAKTLRVSESSIYKDLAATRQKLRNFLEKEGFAV